MIYRNAVKYLQNAPSTSEIQPNAERLQLLCKYLGNPQKNLKYIRLAGSNGKTVCSQLLISVLKEAKIKAGCLTMPINADLKQNIIIDGKPLLMEEAAEYATRVSDAVNQINADIQKKRENDESATERADENFTITDSEFVLSMALLAFKENKCSVCIVESDHNKPDPTKFLPAPFSAVICGTIPSEDKKQMARIRSYICRGIQEIVSAPQNQEAFRMISDTCASANCRLTLPSKSQVSITRLSLRGTDFIYKELPYSIRLCGRFEVDNAVVALEAFDMLIRRGYKISYEHIKAGLSKVHIPSKFELLSAMPFIIADSTHDAIAIETVCESMADFKEITGTKIRLCLPNDEIIDSYLSALKSRGYEIESIITQGAKNDQSAFNADSTPKKYANGFKPMAKEILKELPSDTMVLISGPYAFTSEVRYQVLAILDF